MLESVKISRRQSEIRQALAGLVGKEKPSEEETRSMEALDGEYRGNEVRYRAALIAEDTERREAGAELETRGDKEWSDLIGKFELRQVALYLDEGKQIDGPTKEVVDELRSKGGYRGCPIPLQALEVRAGETIASGVPDPKVTRPIIDRIFPGSVAANMGASLINIDSGLAEYPVCTSAVAAAWAATETGSVGGPTSYQTTDRPLAPNSTLGVTCKITRKSLKQSGPALEDAIRRDVNGAIGAALDKAFTLGAGASGEPAGVLVGSYGITSTAVNGAATWAAFRAAVVRFLTANAAAGPGSVRLLIRPEVYDFMDATLITNTAVSQWDLLVKNVPNIFMTSNALAAPTGGPPVATKALLTVTTGGVPPVFFATWGGVDMVRDVYSDAASGGLRLTALVTADLTVSRPAQLEILTGVQTAAS